MHWMKSEVFSGENYSTLSQSIALSDSAWLLIVLKGKRRVFMGTGHLLNKLLLDDGFSKHFSWGYSSLQLSWITLGYCEHNHLVQPDSAFKKAVSLSWFDLTLIRIQICSGIFFQSHSSVFNLLFIFLLWPGCFRRHTELPTDQSEDRLCPDQSDKQVCKVIPCDTIQDNLLPITIKNVRFCRLTFFFFAASG